MNYDGEERPNTPQDIRDRNWFLLVLAAIIILLFALCSPAAPLPPLPVVRPKPLLSPSHAAAPKVKKMVKATTFSPASELPRATMTMEFVKVTNIFGKYMFTGSVTQPPNQALTFESSIVAVEGWEPLGHFGPVPYEQTSFVSRYSDSESLFIRANLTPITAVSNQTQTGWMPASLVPVVGTGVKTFINPNLPGARAWSVRK